MTTSLTLTARTQFIHVEGTRYAYRRFGSGAGKPLLCLQHFTGTLDHWDPAVTDALASEREVILFESAGVGLSTGTVPTNIRGMADHALAFIDALGLQSLHLLGFSLGGFVAQELAIARPDLIDRMIISGSAPEGGAGSGMDRPELLAVFTDATLSMHDKLKRLFFHADPASQAAASAFIARLSQRPADHDAPAGAEVAPAQLQAMIAWAGWSGDIAAKLSRITQPVLVTNGNNDTMIPTDNSFLLAKGLPDATLIVYPHSGHGALYQWGEAYAGHVGQFLKGR
jgi:pimeloyl-ACP methyl ester carboxylesterase